MGEEFSKATGGLTTMLLYFYIGSGGLVPLSLSLLVLPLRSLSERVKLQAMQLLVIVLASGLAASSVIEGLVVGAISCLLALPALVAVHVSRSVISK